MTKIIMIDADVFDVTGKLRLLYQSPQKLFEARVLPNLERNFHQRNLKVVDEVFLRQSRAAELDKCTIQGRLCDCMMCF